MTFSYRAIGKLIDRVDWVWLIRPRVQPRVETTRSHPQPLPVVREAVLHTERTQWDAISTLLLGAADRAESAVQRQKQAAYHIEAAEYALDRLKAELDALRQSEPQAARVSAADARRRAKVPFRRRQPLAA